MLFASIELAARIERAEALLIRQSLASTAARRGTGDVLCVDLAGGVAGWAEPGSPFNKIAGLGFGGVIDLAELARFEEGCARRGAGVRVELSSLADPALAPLLTGRGYRLVGFENVLGRGLDGSPPGARATDITIEEAGEQELEPWLDAVVDGFAHPDAQGIPSDESFPRELIAGSLRDMTTAGGFLRFVARRGGVIVGGGGMRLSEGVAQLCGAATLPTHRRRGVQTMLLRERLAHAVRAGCDVAVVTTQPGSRSQQNVQREGFELLYVRAVLERRPA